MSAEGLIPLLAVFILLGIWLALVVGGIATARNKNRSPHWMWFGLYPVGALIVFVVLLCLKPLKECPQCLEKSKSHARICPYCGYAFREIDATGQAGQTLPNQLTLLNLRSGSDNKDKAQDAPSGLSENTP